MGAHTDAIRWRRLAAAAVALTLLIAPGAGAAALKTAPDGRALRLTFNEDFRDFQAGPTGHVRWRTLYGDGGDTSLGKRTLASNGEMEVYVDRALGADIGAPDLDALVARNGSLDIVARPTPARRRGRLGDHPFTSGLISSQPSFAQRYGYFEIRARLPGGKGLWPALWMLPADQTWPPEIDIMESIGDPGTVYDSIHSQAAPAFTQAVPVSAGVDHTFSVSWDARSIVWYVDGAEVARRPTPADMNKPMFLIANLAVGGAWPGAPDASTRFPAVFSIRFIRAYQFA